MIAMAGPVAPDPAAAVSAAAVPTAPAAADVTQDDELLTGEAVALDVRPTGFVLRAAGCLIDWMLSVAVFLGLLFVVFTVAGSLDPAASSAVVILILVFAILIVPLTVELAMRGQSLGRLAVGARIVRDDGGAIRFRHALVRALTGVAEIYLTFGGLAAVAALLNPKAKRFGDLLAGTYSQHERVPLAPSAAFGVPVELSEWARNADVAPLPDRLARRIAQFLAQASRLTPASRSARASELAREASRHVHPIPAGDAELFLAAVSVLRREREAAALARRRNILDGLAPTLDAQPGGFPDR